MQPHPTAPWPVSVLGSFELEPAFPCPTREAAPRSPGGKPVELSVELVHADYGSLTNCGLVTDGDCAEPFQDRQRLPVPYAAGERVASASFA